MHTDGLTLHPIGDEDRRWVRQFLRERWGSERQVASGEVFYPADHAGFVASIGGERTGLITYRIYGDACEVTLLDSGRKGAGIGTALLGAVEAQARTRGCTRLWLITTNDNLDALRFYQRRGFVLSRLHPNALARSRLLKPEIPPVGEYGIPLRDEIELEKSLVATGTLRAERDQ